MRSDNELCCIYTPVAQCCYVTMYWLQQTDSVKLYGGLAAYSFLLLLLLLLIRSSPP